MFIPLFDPQISQITPQKNRLRISRGRHITMNVRWRLRNLPGLILRGLPRGSSFRFSCNCQIKIEISNYFSIPATDHRFTSRIKYRLTSVKSQLLHPQHIGGSFFPNRPSGCDDHLITFGYKPGFQGGIGRFFDHLIGIFCNRQVIWKTTPDKR